jgi:type I restriction enzyme S subunit
VAGRDSDELGSTPIKTLISAPITDGPHETPEFLSQGIPFLSVDGIQEGELIFDGCRHISETAHKEYRRKCAPRRDDILFGKAASTGKIARVKVDLEFGVWSPLALIRPDHAEARSDFLEYALKSVATQAQIDVLCTTNTQNNISMQDIPILVVCVAPLPEQRAIAAFLDGETARIDALVVKKERLIELLQEKRTALITRAVTKGLDPTVPMKDSGVMWLGEIPAHWDMKPLSQLLSRITYGFTNPMPVADEGPFMLTALDIGDGKILFGSARRTTDEAFGRLLTDKSRPIEGDILITKDGTLGRLAVAGGERVCINQSVALLRFDSAAIWIDFVQNALRAAPYQDRMIFEAGGTTIKHIYVSRLAKMPLALPAVAEQERISDFVSLHRERIDSLIVKIRNAIDRLKELRAGLISAAVTGKIDVREEVG